MIELIFTVDYEIYGNGQGSLRDHVYEPAESLKLLFKKHNAPLVIFVEAAELEMIEAEGADQAIDLVKQQLRDLYSHGVELGLHLHPQWYNAKYEDGSWLLDYSEYNLCTLPRERIAQIVDSALSYFREIIGEDDFTPLSFRAGNWLFQPTQPVANLLAERGIKVDSSVFKGGLQHQHKLDYSRSLQNGNYWRFSNDVNVPDPHGALLELPIYTQMVPFWKMLTSKRIGLQRKTSPAPKTDTNHNDTKKVQRLMDFMRLRYPLKLDFCRMTIGELTRMMDRVINEDQKDPTTLRPIVAIGHTKDLIDFETVESFLAYLKQKEIPVSTFAQIYPKMAFGKKQI
jgi:hypothetical protein